MSKIQKDHSKQALVDKFLIRSPLDDVLALNNPQFQQFAKQIYSKKNLP